MKIGRSNIAQSDLVVGVNRAAVFIPCHVWVAGDRPLIEREHQNVIGDPLLITGVDAHEKLTRLRDEGSPIWRGSWRCSTEMMGFCPYDLQWVMFSSTIALVYCAFREATRIDVYGADWSGTADFDGTAAGENRSESRWALEKQIWANLERWMRQKGIEVVRHIGNQPHAIAGT